MPVYAYNELLTILAEESAEVVQAACKCQRFGADGVHGSATNLSRLEDEVGDLLAVVDILVERGLVDPVRLGELKALKRAKLARWSAVLG